MFEWKGTPIVASTEEPQEVDSTIESNETVIEY